MESAHNVKEVTDLLSIDIVVCVSRWMEKDKKAAKSC